MTEEKSALPLTPEGFIEKNLPRLKYFAHMAYMFSRIPAFWMAVANTLYYFLDSAYFHTPGGVPIAYLWVSGILFIDNGLLKMAQRFMELHDLTVYSSRVRVEYDWKEPWWYSLVFRLAVFRRGMIKRLVIVIEFAVVALLILILNARLLREGFYVSSDAFPYILKPVTLYDWTLSENIWMWMAIVVAAGVFALINNLIFLLKSPGVFEAIVGALKELPHVHHRAPFVALKLFELIRGQPESSKEEAPCKSDEIAQMIAEILLATYPQKGFTEEEEQKLVAELGEVICRETDPHALETYIRRRIIELKKSGEKKDKEKSKDKK